MFSLPGALSRFQVGAAIVEINVKDSQKLKINLAYEPVIILLGIVPKSLLSYGTGIFTTVLFMVFRKEKQFNCSLIYEMIRKM